MEFYAENIFLKKYTLFAKSIREIFKKKYYVCTMQVKNTYIIFNV